jgi:hypothetical protein
MMATPIFLLLLLMSYLMSLNYNTINTKLINSYVQGTQSSAYDKTKLYCDDSWKVGATKLMK